MYITHNSLAASWSAATSKVIVVRISITYVAIGAVVVVIIVLTIITTTVTVIATNFRHPCLPLDGQSQRPVFG